MAALRLRRKPTSWRLSLALMLSAFASCSHVTSRAEGPRLAARGGAQGAVASDATPRLLPTRRPACEAPSHEGARRAETPGGNPDARRAAQRGLTFVAQEAATWQRQHNCYGCHVQAVTFEALTVGRAHQYEVSDELFAFVRSGLLTVPGGHRASGGLSVGGSGMPATSRAFGGAAFARYDALAGNELREDLVGVAEQLLELQGPDGALRVDDVRFPVVAGPLQAATQALQTWRQAYSRTADERWLTPLRRTEAWMQREARRMTDTADNNNVHLNYAIMGLLAAGAQPSEDVMRALEARLRARQRDDGGWGIQGDEASSAFSTGQSLHALRALGASDSDARVSRGTAWLIEHQAPDGGWSHSGRGKAEAMWAVFGLVSIDRMSLTLEGLRDGQHAAGSVALTARAVDNQETAIREVTLLVDDVPVERACGAALAFSLDTARLGAGVHQIDVVATNVEGQSTRRRVEFYSGDHYLVRAASQWVDDYTAFTLRNVAPTALGGRVSLNISREGSDAPLHTAVVPAAEGPMTFQWDGHDAEGHTMAHGRYVARLAYLDRAGRPLHRVEVPFVHDTPEAQRTQFAQVAGQIQLEDSRGSANTAVELVDHTGRVVAQTQTTEQGNYSFRNVDAGRYRVRVRRAGFAAAEQSVSAVRGAAPAPARAMQLQLQ